MSRSYYIQIPESPTDHLTISVYNNSTQRGAKIIHIDQDKANEPWAKSIQYPSKIISIAGYNIANYTFKTIQKLLTNCNLPVKLRLQTIEIPQFAQNQHIGSCCGCNKSLKQSKKHRCRRCASFVCSKCSKNKRKEVGYNKLVRVCDSCVKRDEFTVEIQSTPLGIKVDPLYGRTDDLGGILVVNVNSDGGIKRAEQLHNVQIEKSVIISINQKNIELLTYNEAFELLRIQNAPFSISCKKWNKNTQSSAKKELEKQYHTAIHNEMKQISNQNEYCSITGRYIGHQEIEDHYAMQLIYAAQQYERKNDLKSASITYENAIKQFNAKIHEIEDHQIKTKWEQKINHYEFELSRIRRILKSRCSTITLRKRLEADLITEKPNVSFKDVQGLVKVKLAIYKTVILPRKRKRRSCHPPEQGLLLFGPPGNGKSMIAKCIAAEMNWTFLSISATSITSKCFGDAERIMRTLFDLARKKKPSILFIDEIDALLTTRGNNDNGSSHQRKNAMLGLFTFSCIVIGATSSPHQVDEAVLRSFSTKILVPHPEYDTRYDLIRNSMQDQPHRLDRSEFIKIAKATAGYSCSDLIHLCQDAVLGPLREMVTCVIEDDLNENNLPKTSIKHFENALNNITPSLSEEELLFYKRWDTYFGSKFKLMHNRLPECLQPHRVNDVAIMTENKCNKKQKKQKKQKRKRSKEIDQLRQLTMMKQ